MSNLLTSYLYTLALLFCLTLVRITTMLMILPVFSNKSFPVKIRVGLALMLTFIMMPILGSKGLNLTISVFEFALLVGREVMVGLILGFSTTILFAAMKLGGEMVGRNMGFGMARVVDPDSGQQISAISTFQGIMALLIFVSINGHHWLLLAIGKSFDLVPITQAQFTGAIPDRLITVVGNIFPMAVKLIAPAMAILLIAQITLALVSRAAPQMNIMIVMMPLKIMIGIVGLIMSLPMFYVVFLKLFHSMQADVSFLMKAMH